MPERPGMSERPGSGLATRPLHFFFLTDCSGSMAGEGKMRALNMAIREALPHLVDVSHGNPHAEVLVRCLAFSTGARWHIADPTPVESLTWTDLSCGGYTDLGEALRMLAAQLQVPPMPKRALPPAIVLISDGMPTDDHAEALAELLELPWGARSVRLAVGIGRDADHDMLVDFMSESGADPITANNPEQLVAAIRWASMHVSRVASSIVDPTEVGGARLAPSFAHDELSEIVW